MTAALLVGLAITAGALVQRATGLGMALVAAAPIVFAIGPADGVPFVNLIGISANAVVLALTWRDLDLRTAGWLALGALPALPVAVLITLVAPAPLLQVGIGVLVMVAAGLIVIADHRSRGNRASTSTPRRTGLIGTGAASAGFGVLAGVGGAPVALFNVRSGWSGPSVIPTMQAFFIVVGATSVLSTGGFDLSPAIWIAASMGLAIGLLLGGALARALSRRQLQIALIAMAALGGLATAVAGIAAL